MKILDRLFTKNKLQIKCEWCACANNQQGCCKRSSIVLKNKHVDKNGYLECDSLDWE